MFYFPLSLGVQNYPCKGQKTKQREETTAVIVLECEDKMLLVQRPKEGEKHWLGTHAHSHRYLWYLGSFMSIIVCYIHDSGLIYWSFNSSINNILILNRIAGQLVGVSSHTTHRGRQRAVGGDGGKTGYWAVWHPRIWFCSKNFYCRCQSHFFPHTTDIQARKYLKRSSDIIQWHIIFYIDKSNGNK